MLCNLALVTTKEVYIHRVPPDRGEGHIENFCWCLFNKPKYVADLFHQYVIFYIALLRRWRTVQVWLPDRFGRKLNFKKLRRRSLKARLHRRFLLRLNGLTYEWIRPASVQNYIKQYFCNSLNRMRQNEKNRHKSRSSYFCHSLYFVLLSHVMLFIYFIVKREKYVFVIDLF